MLYAYGAAFFFVGAAAMLGAGWLWAWMASLEFRERRTILCPETLAPAGVWVDTALLVRTRLAGHQQLRLVACTRWPARQDCDQACTPQVPLVGDHRRLTRFAPFALDPRFLRVNNPVRMSRRMYDAVAAARRAS